jgi:hypothetical protein
MGSASGAMFGQYATIGSDVQDTLELIEEYLVYLSGETPSLFDSAHERRYIWP